MAGSLMETYAVCFDITDDRIRRQAGKQLLCYGERVQKSVFEIAVKDRNQLDKIRKMLLDMLEEGDSLRFYRLCAACREASSTADGEKVAYFPAVIVV